MLKLKIQDLFNHPALGGVVEGDVAAPTKVVLLLRESILVLTLSILYG